MRQRHRMAVLISAVVVGLAAAGVALARPRRIPAPPCPSPEIHISKRDAVVELLCESRVVRRFPATFGANPSGPKEREGDERTPEGEYRITSRLVTPRFHRFLGLDYPNEKDRKHAQEQGIQKPGGGVGIHGVNASRAGIARIWTRVAAATRLSRVWGPTDGCIALVNEDVEALHDAVKVGTRVVITP
jgi:murein L,D-transpeptidase YafK